MISETHMPQGDVLIRDILDRMRHDGCGGRVAKAELLTGIDGSSRPMRRIVLRMVETIGSRHLPVRLPVNATAVSVNATAGVQVSQREGVLGRKFLPTPRAE